MSRQHSKRARRLLYLLRHRPPGAYETVRSIAVDRGPEAVVSIYPMLTPEIELIEKLREGWVQQAQYKRARTFHPHLAKAKGVAAT